MYWCEDCEMNNESNTCDNCNNLISPDEDYHENCPEY